MRQIILHDHCAPPMVHVEQLVRIPLLGLAAGTLRRLAEAASELTMQRGDYIVHQHDQDGGKDSSQKHRSRAGTSGFPFSSLNSSPKAFQGMILGIIWD
jgi:hypothetical protein